MKTSASGKILVAAVIVAIVVFGVVYFIFDPSESAWMPRCLWKTLTDTDCPGCGSQRMAHALLHGDLRGAWQANAFVLCTLPLVGFLLWLELTCTRHPRLYAAVHRPLFIWLLAAAILLWWLLRNLI